MRDEPDRGRDAPSSEGAWYTWGMRYDRLYKELLTTFFLEFLDLFLPAVLEYLDPESIEFLDKEIFTDVVRGERYEADVVVKARFLGRDAYFVIHVENQATAQTRFAERMFRYFARLYEAHNLPVYPVAVLSYAKPAEKRDDTFRVAFPDFEVNVFRSRAIQLNQLNWRDFLNRPSPVAAALMSRMDIAEADRPRVKLECLRMIATLKLDPARMRLLSTLVDVNLALSPHEEHIFQEELQMTDLVEKEEVMEIVTSWERRGRELGRQEGRQEGAADVVLPLLRRQVGVLSESREAAIRALSLEQLQRLNVDLLAFHGGADLDAWLIRAGE